MWNRGGNELPQSKPDGFASSLGEGASGAPGSFALQPKTLPPCQGPHPRGGCLRSRLGEFRQIPPQALPRQLSRRESQAVNLDAKVLGTKRKFPVVLLAPPLGELSPQVTERAHAVNSVAKVSIAMRNLPAMPKAPSQRGLSAQQTGGVSADTPSVTAYAAPAPPRGRLCAMPETLSPPPKAVPLDRLSPAGERCRGSDRVGSGWHRRRR